MNKKHNILNNTLIIILIGFIIFCSGCQTGNGYNENAINTIIQESKRDSLIQINSKDDSIPVYKYFYYDRNNCCNDGYVSSIIITGNTNTVNYHSGKITYNILENFGTDLPSIASDTTIDSIFIYKNGSQILYRKNK